MLWLKRHLTDIFCIFLLTVVVGVLAIQNYMPGRFLTGIDNFHIEFDLGLAASRAWNGVWQQNQGMGIVSGLAQMTELPRVAIYQVLSWVMPTDLIRYSYVFGNLYLGVIGLFFLTWYLSKSRVAGLAGAIFYLFNLGTLQVFFMPTEMFVVNYAALPWFFLLIFKYLRQGSRATLLWYTGILFLFAPMSMTPTVFAVYLLFLGIICVGYVLSRSRWDVKWRRVLVVVGVTLGMSMYFLLPFANFAIFGSHVLREAKINKVFSVENYLFNASRNEWSDLVKIKGMWFDYSNYIDGEWSSLFHIWDSWLADKMLLQYGLSVFILIGLIHSVLKQKYSYLLIGVVGLVALIALRGEGYPLGSLITKLRNIPIVSEAFRTPFTKFSPYLMLSYSLLFGVGVGVIVRAMSIGKIGRIASLTLLVVIIGTQVYLYKPIFLGNFFENRVRLIFPQEYFSLFRFMKTQSSSRVVSLPSPNNLGWIETDWGYLGSGFLWYGIGQPILDRAFDVWSPYNEGFYNEFSTVLYGGKLIDIASVLDKYDVRYIFLDESVIIPGQDRDILRIKEIKKVAVELGWKLSFQEGFLTVWDIGKLQTNYVSAPVNYTWVEAETSKVRRDVAWEGVGHYVTSNKLTQQQNIVTTIYPFSELMREEIKGVKYPPSPEASDGRGGVDGVRLTANGVQEGQELVIPGWQVGDIVRINFRDGQPLPAYSVNDQSGPVFLGKEKPEEEKSYIVARVSEGEEWGEYRKDFRFKTQESNLEVQVEGEPQVYDFSKQGQGTIDNCDVLKRGVAEKIDAKYSADQRGAVCDYVVMPELDTRLSYLLRMQGENREGRSLKFFLYNTGSKRNDIEYLLGKNVYDQTFSLLPWSFDGNYTLNIETRSFGNYAENMVAPVEVRWLPLEQIASATLVGQNMAQDHRISNDLEVSRVKKYGTWLYVVETKNGGLLKLSQGYDEGWVSPYLEHVKVDGWANGWMVPTGEHQIIIFYWPQLLQYAGFVLLGVTIVVVVRHKN